VKASFMHKLAKRKVKESKLVTESNPFVFERPLSEGDILISRDRALDWIRKNLQNGISLPLVIEGEPGVGKSTFLCQVYRLGKRAGLVSIYLDLKLISHDSFTEFVWDITKMIRDELTLQGVAVPKLEKRMLLIRPWQVFKQRFWQELHTTFSEQTMLIILDNFDALASRPSAPETNRSYRQYLFEMLTGSQEIFTVASVTGRLSAFTPMELSPFHRLLSYHLPLFSKTQTSRLVSNNNYFYFVEPVVDYIHSLTWGHPGDIQRLCHVLFSQLHGKNYQIVTVADIVSTLRLHLKPGDFRRATYHQRSKISYLPNSS
jgi:KaiC/GvpD/RAD55 family RecA-like ATPase